ncbi:MAG TPA: hypothetical protein VMV05_06260, partial [bacterium]|nr:hypothetical protein [bacterium]
EIVGEDPPKSKLKDRPYEFSEMERKELFESLSRALKWNPIPAKYGGYLDLDASKYHLFRQDREGQFVFGHPDADSLVLLTSDGKIKFPDEEYSRRNH